MSRNIVSNCFRLIIYFDDIFVHYLAIVTIESVIEFPSIISENNSFALIKLFYLL